MMTRDRIKQQVETYVAYHGYGLGENAINHITDVVAATKPLDDEELEVEVSCSVNEYLD